MVDLFFDFKFISSIYRDYKNAFSRLKYKTMDNKDKCKECGDMGRSEPTLEHPDGVECRACDYHEPTDRTNKEGCKCYGSGIIPVKDGPFGNIVGWISCPACSLQIASEDPYGIKDRVEALINDATIAVSLSTANFEAKFPTHDIKSVSNEKVTLSDTGESIEQANQKEVSQLDILLDELKKNSEYLNKQDPNSEYIKGQINNNNSCICRVQQFQLDNLNK